MFFHANTIKKGQKMPNYDVHAKHHFFTKPLHKKPNFWNLALKMPTWQPLLFAVYCYVVYPIFVFFFCFQHLGHFDKIIFGFFGVPASRLFFVDVPVYL